MCHKVHRAVKKYTEATNNHSSTSGASTCCWWCRASASGSEILVSVCDIKYTPRKLHKSPMALYTTYSLSCGLKRFPAVRLLFRRLLLLAAPLVVALSVAVCSSGLVHRRPVGLFLITASPLPSPPSAPHTSSLIKDFCVCLGINLWL